MGTGAKIALVAFLIVMVVVVAKVVQNSGDDKDQATQSPATAKVAKANPTSATGKKVTSNAKRVPTRTRRANVFDRPNLNTSGGYRRNVSKSTNTSSPRGLNTTRTGERRPAPSRTTATGRATSGAATDSQPAVGTATTSPAATLGVEKATTGSAAAAPLTSSSSLESFEGKKTVPGASPAPTTASPGSDSTVVVKKTPAVIGEVANSQGIAAAATTGSATAIDRRRSLNLPAKSESGRLSTAASGQPSAVTANSSAVSSSSAQREAGYPRKHTVRSGESYWILAKKYYGKGQFYKPIMNANSSAKLQPGVIVTIPAPPAATASVTPAPAGSTLTRSVVGKQRPVRRKSVESTPSDSNYFYYTVQRGETLSGIAKKFYGNGRAYGRIQDANRALRYETLQAGAKIRVPRR